MSRPFTLAIARASAVCAALAVFALLPADVARAGSITTANACLWSLDGYWRAQDLTLVGAADRRVVNPGGGITVGGASVHASLPAWVPEYGYMLGLLKPGLNEIPAQVWVAVEGRGTKERTQVLRGAVTATTTITTTAQGGFASATPLDVTVPLPDRAWTAATAGTVELRQAVAGSLPTIPAGLDGAGIAPRGSIYVSAELTGSSRLGLDCLPGVPNREGTAFADLVAAPFELAAIDPTAEPTPAPVARPRIRSNALRARDGEVTVALTCPPGRGRCRGTVALLTARKVAIGGHRSVVTLARGRYSIADGGRAQVRVGLTRRGRALVGRGDTIAAKLVLAAGPDHQTIKRLPLRPPGREG